MEYSKNRLQETYQNIIYSLIGDVSKDGICGINITDQFQPEAEGKAAISQSINAAFLINLAGRRHSKYQEASVYLEKMESDMIWASLVTFYKEGQKLLLEEFEKFCLSKKNLEIVDGLNKKINDQKENAPHEIQEEIWKLFHPEAVDILNNQESQIKKIREKRQIEITKLNENLVQDVSKEILFTANALLTLPSNEEIIAQLDINKNLKNILSEVFKERQIYWYDHPIQIGVEPEKNEILYGLRHLSEAFQYEKETGRVDKDGELTCILSASVTHKGLQKNVKEYIEHEIKKVKGLTGLRIYLFTEEDTERLIKELLLPAAERYLSEIKNPDILLKEVVGVDGKYGRHYSFLKAIAAFWHVFIDEGIKAAFKIDLDQVFPQEVLSQETGKTAFQHLMTPLWGAQGFDYKKHRVDLGMIAGALVNEGDIAKSLFTPDVTYPSPPFKGENSIFCSKIPQALSTVAEMMMCYTNEKINGNKHCIYRIHVTGGTSGITVDALRKYRPFTPSFIGRAEDQAYLLSALFPERLCHN